MSIMRANMLRSLNRPKTIVPVRAEKTPPLISPENRSAMVSHGRYPHRTPDLSSAGYSCKLTTAKEQLLPGVLAALALVFTERRL